MSDCIHSSASRPCSSYRKMFMSSKTTLSPVGGIAPTGDRVGLFPEAGAPVGRVFYNRGAEFAPHFEAVEREILSKVEEKRRQSGRMPTALVVDVSRLGMAWLRPPEVWADRLAAKLFRQPHAFVGLALVSSPLTSITLVREGIWRRRSPPPTRQRMSATS